MQLSHFFTATIMYDRCTTGSRLLHVVPDSDLYQLDLCHRQPLFSKHSHCTALDDVVRTLGCSAGYRRVPLFLSTRGRGTATRTCSRSRRDSSGNSHGEMRSGRIGEAKEQRGTAYIYLPHPRSADADPALRNDALVPNQSTRYASAIPHCFTWHSHPLGPDDV